jgi:hypothetical protein
MGLLEKTKEGGPTHEEKIDEIRRLFPKTKRWLDWWNMANVSSTLFPSLRTIPEGGDNLPDTNNAQESMHRLYYMMRYFFFAFSAQLTFNSIPATERNH